jgi:hypothetical protein
LKKGEEVLEEVVDGVVAEVGGHMKEVLTKGWSQRQQHEEGCQRRRRWQQSHQRQHN